MNDKKDFIVTIPSAPDFEGFIDEDILDRFKDTSMFYGDIINAQLIKTNRILIEKLDKINEN